MQFLVLLVDDGDDHGKKAYVCSCKQHNVMPIAQVAFSNPNQKPWESVSVLKKTVVVVDDMDIQVIKFLDQQDMHLTSYSIGQRAFRPVVEALKVKHSADFCGLDGNRLSLIVMKCYSVFQLGK